MKIWNIGQDQAIDEIFREAGLFIKEGNLVAFPTETVYGLGGDGLNPEACKKIFAAKGRPADNPLILHIYQTKQLDELTLDVPETAKALIKAFLPGGFLMMEMGIHQAEPITKIALEMGWIELEPPRKDYGGIERVVTFGLAD